MISTWIKQRSIAGHVEFKKWDLVWIHLLKERFLHGKFSKLKPRADDGASKVMQKVGKNACKIELPENYSVSNTFNVSYLNPYFEEINLDSRASLFLFLFFSFAGESFSTKGD